MTYTFAQRRRIHRKAQRLVGVKKDAQDRADYIRQCMDDMVQGGETDDPEEARTICELLWDEEESDLGD